jgi:hypothetical protein
MPILICILSTRPLLTTVHSVNQSLCFLAPTRLTLSDTPTITLQSIVTTNENPASPVRLIEQTHFGPLSAGGTTAVRPPQLLPNASRTALAKNSLRQSKENLSNFT